MYLLSGHSNLRRATEGLEDFSVDDTNMVDELMADFNAGNISAWAHAPARQARRLCFALPFVTLQIPSFTRH